MSEKQQIFMNTYGVVLIGDIATHIAVNVFEGLTEREFEDDYSALLEVLAEAIGVSYYPCFTGTVSSVKADGSDDEVRAQYQGQSLFLLEAYPPTTTEKNTHNDIEDLVSKIKDAYKACLPDDFDIRDSIRHVCGTVCSSDTMRRDTVGYRNFGDTVEITDPCYNDDVWCRMNLNIKPGKYMCAVWKNTDVYEVPDFSANQCEIVVSDTRVGVIGIYRNGIVPNQSKFVNIGTIGVDAGLAGFFENKPNYTDDEWKAFCESIRGTDGYRNGCSWIKPEGFFSESGYGDGSYSVMAYRDHNRDVVALEIHFI